MSFCHKLWFSNPYIFATQCRRPLIFQTMNHVRPNNISLKHQRFTPLGCKDVEIRKFEFVVKTHFLLREFLSHIRFHFEFRDYGYNKFLNCSEANIYFQDFYKKTHILMKIKLKNLYFQPCYHLGKLLSKIFTLSIKNYKYIV